MLTEQGGTVRRRVGARWFVAADGLDGDRNG